MHCAACAKKIAAKLHQVQGVGEVRANVKKNSTYIAARPQITPSPRKMWEAVEAAGFKPVKLVGPSGVFTSKPVK
jgi:Cu+-exporting ATPase